MQRHVIHLGLSPSASWSSAASWLSPRSFTTHGVLSHGPLAGPHPSQAAATTWRPSA